MDDGSVIFSALFCVGVDFKIALRLSSPASNGGVIGCLSSLFPNSDFSLGLGDGSGSFSALFSVFAIFKSALRVYHQLLM